MNGADDTMGDNVRGGCGCGPELRVDRWLRDTLASRFDGVLNERLPDDWLRLIGAGGMSPRER